MPRFEVITVSAELPLHPVVPFYKLLVDGKCDFDEFCLKMEKAGNQQQALEKMQTILVTLCKGERVPTAWFQELKHRPKDDSHLDYEIRSKQLRIYLFEDKEEGKIIVLGELKKGGKTQNKAIQKMREIKRAYFASKA